MQKRAAERRWEQLHEKRPYHDGTFSHWSENLDRDHPFHFSDGFSVWVTDGVDPSPDDRFLQVESAGPPQQPVGEQPEAAEQAGEEG